MRIFEGIVAAVGRDQLYQHEVLRVFWAGGGIQEQRCLQHGLGCSPVITVLNRDCKRGYY